MNAEEALQEIENHRKLIEWADIAFPHAAALAKAKGITASKDVEEVVAAMRSYVGHWSKCEKKTKFNLTCTCGLDALLFGGGLEKARLTSKAAETSRSPEMNEDKLVSSMRNQIAALQSELQSIKQEWANSDEMLLAEQKRLLGEMKAMRAEFASVHADKSRLNEIIRMVEERNDVEKRKLRQQLDYVQHLLESARADGNDLEIRVREAEEGFRRAEARLNETQNGNLPSDLVADLAAELNHARAKFPKNRFLTVALLEEAGELAKAYLQRETVERIKREAIQVMTVAARIYSEGDATMASVDDEGSQP